MVVCCWNKCSRQPKARDGGISRRTQNVPLHGVFIGIVKNQPEMVKADNPAKRFGYAREQGVEIGPPCNRPGERQNSFIDVPGGCSHGPDHNGFRLLSSAARTKITLSSRCYVCADTRTASTLTALPRATGQARRAVLRRGRASFRSATSRFRKWLGRRPAPGRTT